MNAAGRALTASHHPASHFTRGTDEAGPIAGSPSTLQQRLWATRSAPNAKPRVLKHSEAGPYYLALETDAYSCIVLQASAALVVPSGPIVPGPLMTDPPGSSATSSSEADSRVVRVFISSTFRDFGEERDLIAKRVFPELRRRARERFVEVIGVDLRWGITEQESAQGETLPICLREIERARPYFIGLLGERYGWTPAVGQFPELLLEKHPWLREHAGGKSVTELEVLHGVLNNPEMAGRAYFYFRDAGWSAKKGPDFRSEGAAERAKLEQLKSRIRSSQFPVIGYSTPDEVADRVTDDLWRLIDAQYPADEVPTELERERRSHEAYAAERRRLYVGQDATVAALLARLEDADDTPGEEGSRTRTTLVTAESGTGKSALLANALARYRTAHPDHVVIEHYIASTSAASDPLKLIRRVSEEIRRLTGASRKVAADEQKLVEQFAEWLSEASWWARKREVCFVLALDALDKLSGRSDLRWLPNITAPNVRLVVSSLDDGSADGGPTKAMRRRQPGELQARPFTPEVARRYIVETLARRGRRLPAREVDRIVTHPRSTLPIYLKTIVEELSVFGSHDGLPHRITECLAAAEPDDLFQVILARLEEDLGDDAVRKPLEAIWASAGGMSEDELIGFTGASPLEIARLRLSLDDALYEADGLLRIAHAYAAKGVERRYVQTDDARRALHLALGLWWEKQDASARMAMEMNWHLFSAEAWDELRRILTEPLTGMAAVAAIPSIDLVRTWRCVAIERGATSPSRLMIDQLSLAWPRWKQELAGRTMTGYPLLKLNELLRCAGAVGALALEVAQEQERAARLMHERDRTHRHRIVWCESLNALAITHELLGNGSDALQVFEQAARLETEHTRNSVGADSMRSRSASLHNLGVARLRQHRLDEARHALQESIELKRRLFSDDATLDASKSLGHGLMALADIAIAEDDLESALSLIHEARHLIELTLGADPTTEERRSIALLLQRLGVVSEARNELDDATSYFEQSLEAMHFIAALEATPASLRDLGVANFRLGGVLEAKEDLRGALVRYEESLAIARRLIDQSDHPLAQWSLDMQRYLIRCFSVSLRVMDFERGYGYAVECWNRAVSLAEPDRSPREYATLLFIACNMLRCEMETGRVADASETANSIRDLVNSVLSASSDDSHGSVGGAIGSSALFQCAEGMDLVATLHGAEGNHQAQSLASIRAGELRAAAEELEAEENSAADKEPEA